MLGAVVREDCVVRCREDVAGDRAVVCRRCGTLVGVVRVDVMPCAPWALRDGCVVDDRCCRVLGLCVGVARGRTKSAGLLERSVSVERAPVLANGWKRGNGRIGRTGGP